MVEKAIFVPSFGWICPGEEERMEYKPSGLSEKVMLQPVRLWGAHYLKMVEAWHAVPMRLFEGKAEALHSSMLDLFSLIL